MTSHGLLARLQAGGVLVGDGAWGTMLMARGLPRGMPPETFALERPEAIREVARLYLDAGADLITTDTFGASSLNLAGYGLAERAVEINRTAVTLAREAAAGRAYVSASVGPTGRMLAPVGEAEPEQVEAAFSEQIRAQAEAGADLICIETMTDLQEATLAVAAAKAAAPGLPVMVTMTFQATPRGFFTMMGASVERAARELAGAGADVLGSNCGHGVEPMLEVAREFRRVTSLPLLIQPNAGLPELRGSELVYPETPELFAERLPALLEAGVQIIGGCCGTTPEHVRALRAALASCRSA